MNFGIDDTTIAVLIGTALFLFVLLPLMVPLGIGISRGTGGRFWRNTLTGMGMGVLTIAAVIGWFPLLANTRVITGTAFCPTFIGGVFGIVIGAFFLTRWVLNRLAPPMTDQLPHAKPNVYDQQPHAAVVPRISD